MKTIEENASVEATKEQLGFIARVKKYHELKTGELEKETDSNLYEFRADEPLVPYETELTIPEKFRYIGGIQARGHLRT